MVSFAFFPSILFTAFLPSFLPLTPSPFFTLDIYFSLLIIEIISIRKSILFFIFIQKELSYIYVYTIFLWLYYTHTHVYEQKIDVHTWPYIIISIIAFIVVIQQNVLNHLSHNWCAYMPRITLKDTGTTKKK